jgi:hypothetical protein
VLIRARWLLDCLRHPRSRADELWSVRTRLLAQPEPRRAGPEQIAVARELERMRLDLAARFLGVEACASCARGHPLPNGRWQGGHCCGTRTERVFTDDELAALRLTGSRPGALVAPVADHAGCAFRGPRGCSLEPRHRPNICFAHVCDELARELQARGELREVEARREALLQRMTRFAGLRQASAERERADRLERELQEAFGQTARLARKPTGHDGPGGSG